MSRNPRNAEAPRPARGLSRLLGIALLAAASGCGGDGDASDSSGGDTSGDSAGDTLDDTAGDSGAVCMEPAAIDDLQRYYNISVNITHAAFPKSDGPTGDFFRDFVTLSRALHAVTNDGPASPAGPGPRVAPTAPPICGA